jgi:hypothetical protein
MQGLFLHESAVDPYFRIGAECGKNHTGENAHRSHAAITSTFAISGLGTDPFPDQETRLAVLAVTAQIPAGKIAHPDPERRFGNEQSARLQDIAFGEVAANQIKGLDPWR